jgi:outer membrane protein OmpA-like peptidoglycan-associated protein
VTRYRWAAAVLLALGGCAELPEAPATAAAPDYPTTVPGLVTVAPLRHDSDVALIAPDIEHVIWASTTLQAAQVSAPARAAAPASARCADRDGDGVCDERDRCPDSARGERVDRFGCGCEVTVVLQFEFDSATLTSEDKVTLDRVALRMKELEFVAAEAIGHTDSVGTEQYNLELSRRRAQAAVDHLAARSVTAERMQVHGLGESEPVADNATAEGRAKNRRVVLRRADCTGSP